MRTRKKSAGRMTGAEWRCECQAALAVLFIRIGINDLKILYVIIGISSERQLGVEEFL